jgi:hypothetical protein
MQAQPWESRMTEHHKLGEELGSKLSDYISQAIPGSPVYFTAEKLGTFAIVCEVDAKRIEGGPKTIGPFRPERGVNGELADIFVNNRRLSAGKKEARILALLLSKPGQYFSKSEIKRTVWPGQVARSHTFETHIYRLRKFLHEEAPGVTIECEDFRSKGGESRWAVIIPQPAQKAA